MQQVDSIIHCRWLLPIVPREALLENQALVIQADKIVDILPQNKVAERYQSQQHVQLTNHVLLPGFVNTHTHSPMTLFRGLADDLPLMDWLNNHIWPAERKWLCDEFIEDGTKIAIAEMLKTGTTCFNEHFFFPEAIAKVVLQHGIRACIGPTIINFPTNWSQNEEEGFEKFLAARQAFDDHPLLTWSLAPHSPYGTTDVILKKIAHFSKEYNLPVHMHLHETAHEVQESLKQIGKRPLKRLADLGLLSPRFQAVHMTEINAEDIDLIQQSGMHIIHCPESNLKLASGYSPIEAFLKAGINVALGTDGAASNNDLDMLGEMRTAALIGKAVADSAIAVSAFDAIEMATINGARAMGLSHEIGSLEIGKSADMIAIDLAHVNTIPTYNPISLIVYSASNRQITDVWVAGKQLLESGKLMTFDQEQLLGIANKWQARIKCAATAPESCSIPG